MMIKLFTRFLLLGLLASILLASGPTRIGSAYDADLFDITYQTSYYMPANIKFLLDSRLDVTRFNDVYFDLEFQKSKWENIFFGQVKYLFSSRIPLKTILGMQLNFQRMNMHVGIQYASWSYHPYLLMSFQWKSIQPFISFGDKLQLGMYYGFGLEEPEEVREYFSLITPHENFHTNKDKVFVKGYYLDEGDLYLNGEKLDLREDGLFSEKVNLEHYGRNVLHFFMMGKNIKSFEHEVFVDRLYPYFDLPQEQQIEWLKMIDFLQFPEGSLFEPERPVLKKEFYMQLATLIDQKKKNLNLKRVFTDVEDETLKEVLYGFYNRGLVKVLKRYFRPDEPILRQEALTVVSRLLPEKEDLEQYEFQDISSNYWVYDAVNKLANYLIIDSRVIDPKRALSREELYTLFINLDLQNNYTDPVLDEGRPELVSEDSLFIDDQQSTLSTADLQHNFNTQEFGFDDLHIFNTVKNIRVTYDQFLVRGKGPVNMVLRINNQLVQVSHLGRFADQQSLKPGMNTISINVGEEAKVFAVLYLKSFDDLSPHEYFTDLLEKIATLGLIDAGSTFRPADYVKRGELISALVTAGLLDPKHLNKIKNEDEDVSYEESLQLINRLAGLDVLFDSTFEETLTRKVFALLLYEIPGVKEKVKAFYTTK
jgi:hypothetical protein